MKLRNYLNLDNHTLDGYIYRYMTFDRFYDLFDTSNNVLSSPYKWRDPFETLLLNAKFLMKDGTPYKFSYSDQIYCQCWTIESRSDALWKIYCPQKCESDKGIRIRTTFRKLGDSISNSLKESNSHRAFIGKVSYMSQKSLIEHARSEFKNERPLDKIARPLLMKRYPFRHEAEVRLIYIASKYAKPTGNKLFPYQLNPHNLVDQVMIDPRFDPLEVRSTKQEIRRRTGYKGKIEYSLLYRKPKDLIIDTDGVY